MSDTINIMRNIEKQLKILNKHLSNIEGLKAIEILKTVKNSDHLYDENYNKVVEFSKQVR